MNDFKEHTTRKEYYKKAGGNSWIEISESELNELYEAWEQAESTDKYVDSNGYIIYKYL